ncbi:hypothetical protein LJB81_00755 [Desulfovibrio sp. OttesenSCG-928-M14]|nr:hypothetical protein [Desulfovibrio sp. OttesenSCG-928-M14]
MPPARKVDAVLNVFAKPYQTALSALSLLRHSGESIDRIFFQFEPQGSRYDAVPPYAVAEYLGGRAQIFQPDIWLECEALAPQRLTETAYRMSVRYQHAFEHTDKRFLFITHNDVLVVRDIVSTLLEAADGHFVVGPLGQCWNCPASSAELVKEAGLGDSPCSPLRYYDFRPDYAGLCRLYSLGRERGFRLRAYDKGWQAHYDPSHPAWPLPECRVNEWGCLVDVAATKDHVSPLGPVLPFGAFEACGELTYDTSVAWFRALNRLGLKARHVDIDHCLRHWIGNDKMTRAKHAGAEERARMILEKQYPDFVVWCRTHNKGLF